VVIANSDFTETEIIDSYSRDGQDYKINAPSGIYVTEDGDIYIAEQNMGEIIHLSSGHEFVRALGKPQITGLDITYAPVKVVVDSVGRIYVKAKSVYEGIIELNTEGKFNRFIGANKVQPSLLERFYRMIATEEQRSRMQLWLPTDYSDIAIDRDGFIYATVKDANTAAPVKKLNSKGEDVMPEYDLLQRPRGDYYGADSLSMLTSVATAPDGRFAVIDSNYARVFVYSEDTHLLYILGGTGKTEGSLNSPVDITFMDDRILILDLVTQSIEVFKPTEYGSLINKALACQMDYDYENAARTWQQVLDINSSFHYANLGIGKYKLRSGDYKGALECFKLAGDREFYILAFAKATESFIDRYFSYIVLGILLLTAFLIARSIYKKYAGEKEHTGKLRRIMKRIRYEAVTWPMRIISRPFKSFDDVKYNDAGSVVMGIIIFMAYAWSVLIKTRYTGFMVYFTDKDNINVLMVILSALLPFILFIFGNWAVGILIDGKGTMKDIFKMVSYALYPCVFLNLVGTLLSNLITDGAVIVNFLYTMGFVIFCFYAFIGIVMIHQFSFTKTVVSVILTIIAMLIIIFIGLLLVILLGGFINDWMTIFTEMRLHL
jgi:tetratricopeptide (TPR) repeat protein